MSQVKGWILTGLLLLPAMCHAAPQVLKDAQLCVNITSKLERLYCFDQVFATPLMAQHTALQTSTHAVEWLRATKNEEQRQAGSSFFLGREEDNDNVWLTASAIGAVPPRPILMLSCIDGISRVEIVLSHYFETGSMQVAVNSAASKGQRWQSDNSGYIFRTGRGLPAIKVMKSMLADNALILHSDTEEIDGLQFDTTGLKQAITPLRKVCRW
ncbi:type VI secretion-associated protein, VC_A0118 family [Shewanella psychrophila]|uniref:Type VI secretion-associated protein, VC_A0118 family n=1 Tax=Shewanella psychrophila TaxID=225848 RepID=A0A1S6HL54_9GAMM|nr:type VI secretion system-associated protein VasI [Shewanella psychrophila]AQS36232.1 type VI secretion-associated protein, VC_A0118 family [Shewanella psychrophila]